MLLVVLERALLATLTTAAKGRQEPDGGKAEGESCLRFKVAMTSWLLLLRQWRGSRARITSGLFSGVTDQLLPNWHVGSPGFQGEVTYLCRLDYSSDTIL